MNGQAADGDRDGLEGEADDLAGLLQAGKAAWPDLDVSLSELAEYLAGHEAGWMPPLERAGDVYLACGCALRKPRALESLDGLLRATVARAVSRIDASPSFADLVAQDLRARLLVGDRPKISEYAGRAALGSWLKTAAVRAALNLRRAKGDQAHEEVPSQLLGPTEPELDLVRARYRTDFEEAVREALKALPDRDRALLQASVGGGKSIDELGALYGVGRSTAARWLVAAREALAAETRRRLIERLRLTPAELDSVAAVVRSQIDVSIVRLLGENED
jgi:RNA polymerase sigma-70 factor (ECF subfamily)